MEIKKALEEIKKDKERKFDQTVDLIVNLKGIDSKRDSINIIATIPNKFKEKKVCGFLTEKSKLIPTITELEFKKYSEKSALKKLVKDYDYFISVPKLMPKVASTFGKVLGPAGKMPSPQLGIVLQENEKGIQEAIDKISTSLKIRIKEASVKVAIGKSSMDDEKVMQNIKSVYTVIENSLPKKRDNIKNVMVKLTMGKPVKVEI